MATALTPTAGMPAAAEQLTVPAWAWLVVALAILATYAMTLDNGLVLGHLAASGHEFFHDARHFVGVPCH